MNLVTHRGFVICSFLIGSASFLGGCKTRSHSGAAQETRTPQTEDPQRRSAALEALSISTDPAANKGLTIDALYQRFLSTPELSGDLAKARQRLLLGFKSRSPLPASPAHPRLIAYNQDASVVVSSAAPDNPTFSDKERLAAQTVEIMEYDSKAGRFRFHSLTFDQNEAGLESVTLDDPKCTQCHSQERPIWDAMTGWPGFYGSIANTLAIYDPSSQNNPDTLGSRGPNAKADSHPEFKRAEWDAFNRLVWVEGGGYRQRPYFRHFDLGEVDGKANWHFVKAAVRNMEFGSLLTQLQARQLVHGLTKEHGQEQADDILASYFYLNSVAVLPAGTTPSNSTSIPFNEAAFAFEQSLKNDNKRKQQLADVIRIIRLSQSQYAEDFYSRQTRIFANVFAVGEVQQVADLVRSSFNPLEKESPGPVVENHARNLLFLLDHKVNTALLSTVALGSDVKTTFDASLPVVKPDSRGVFRIGSAGTIFDRICDAWLQERKRPGQCISGARRD